MDARPLLQALHDLSEVYQEALSCAEALIGALISGDPSRVRDAVMTQTTMIDTIANAETRRRAAEGLFVEALRARAPGGSGSERELFPDTINSSLLLTLLPPDEGTELRDVRHTLLATLVRLQSMNRQAALLARSAQAVVTRSVSATMPQAQALAYGSRGELALTHHEDRPRPARWA